MDNQELNIDELWENYHRNSGGEKGFYMNRLIEHYFPLVKSVAKSLNLNLSPILELDDLIQYGVFGLRNCIKKYDETKGNFERYVSTGIKISIYCELRSLSYFKKYTRLRGDQLKKATRILKEKLNRKPNEEELIKELSKKDYLSNPYTAKAPRKMNAEKKAKTIIQYAKILDKKVFSLYSKNGSEELIKDLEDKKYIGPLIELERKDREKFIKKILTPEERLILNNYYCRYRATSKKNCKEFWKGMSMGEIGKILGKTGAAVSLNHKTILKKLKKRLTSKGYTLESCLNDL